MEQVPYKKMIRVSLAVVPLFGIMAATPALLIDKGGVRNMPLGFIFISLAATLIALINILLIRFSGVMRTQNREALRYLYSAVCCTLLICLVFYTLVQSGLIGRLIDDLPVELSHRPTPRQAILFPLLQGHSMNLVFFILMEMVMLRDRKQRIELENSQLRLANLEARNTQLQQQMHPHFLFNSLSTLRSLINRQPEQAEEFLVKLSELLRFSINNNTHSTVKLQEEMELCSNYLTMQQVRFGDALQFSIDVPAYMLTQYSVPVYSIQLLIDNAIKHNVLTKEQPLHIAITGNAESRTINVHNNLQAKSGLKTISGIGLANLAERYSLLGDKSVDIRQTESAFSVTINVLTV